MTRLRAFSIHLTISLIVGLALLALAWFVWYPAPMLFAFGGHEIFLLVVGVDVVLGPLLTLVAFKPGKPKLIFDLVVIAALQAGAMAYGVQAFLEPRPVYVAAVGTSFHVVQATAVTDANLRKANTALPWWGPIWVGTKQPVDRFEAEEVQDVIRAGGGRGNFPHLHIPYEAMAEEVLAKSLPIPILLKDNSTNADEIRGWLKRHNHDEKSARFQPIQISSSEFIVMLDGKSGAVLGIAPFKP